jgi:glycosyltransferase involved in cell wall biosynthesis
LFGAYNILPGMGFAGLGAPGMARWFRSVARESNRFDVLHIHFGRDLVGIPVAAMARKYGIPYVLQTHGMVIPSKHPLATPLDLTWTRRLLRDADAVFHLTEQERDQLLAVAGAQLRLLPLTNGVPNYAGLAESVIRPDLPEVLFVARLHERKRPRLFVEMAQALLAQGIEARFTLVGPDEGEGAAVRAGLDGEDRISWEGALAPAEIPERMARAAVYVLPAVREPYPMAVLEAMSVGLPVVLSTDCGLAQIVQRSGCGIVVNDGLAAFTAAVREILADPGLAREMGERGQMLVRREFSMSAIGDRLIDVYSQTIGN